MPKEPLPRIVGAVDCVQEFDGGEPVEPCIAGFPHLPHAAFAELVNQLVMREGMAAPQAIHTGGDYPIFSEAV